MAMFTQLGFEPEGLLKDHVRSRAGEVHDLLVLAHFVEAAVGDDAHDRRSRTSCSATARTATDGRPAATRLSPRRPRLARAGAAAGAAGPPAAGDAGAWRRGARRWPAAIAAATARYPTAPALIDDDGSLTLRRAVDRPPTASAAGCAARGVGPRQHRRASSPATTAASCSSVVAAAKLGADIVYLNTGFAGPAARRRRRPRGHRHGPPRRRVRRRSSPSAGARGRRRRQRAAPRSAPSARCLPLAPTRRVGRQVILTSGTTGRPKGAARTAARRRRRADAAAVERCRSGPATPSSSPPRCSTPGASSHLGVGLGMSSTAVLQSQFDPEAHAGRRSPSTAPAGSSSCRSCCSASSPSAARSIARYDTSSLRYIASSGSALGATAGDGGAPPLRADPLQHLRLDRGLAGDDRRAGRPPGGPVDGRPAGAGQRRCGSSTPTAARCSVRTRSGGSSSAAASRFDGYTGGGGKEQHRRAAVERRPRALRPPTAGCSSTAATTT